MRCKICGAKLTKEGDICSNCYKEFLEEEDLKKDVNEVYKFKRRYYIPYELLKYLEVFIIFALATFGCIMVGNGWGAAAVVLILAAIIVGLLAFDKQLAKSTKCIFYEKKVVYNFDFLFIHTERIVKYSDLRDVTYYQTMRQKKFGFGDLCFYAKGVIPGATLLNGFQIKNVGEVAEKLEKIGTIVNLAGEEE